MLPNEEKLFIAISNAIKNKVIDNVTILELLDYKIISYSPGTVNKEDMELWTKANISAIIKGFIVRDGETLNLNRYKIDLLHLSIQYDKYKEEFSIDILETEL